MSVCFSSPSLIRTPSFKLLTTCHLLLALDCAPDLPGPLDLASLHSPSSWVTLTSIMKPHWHPNSIPCSPHSPSQLCSPSTLAVLCCGLAQRYVITQNGASTWIWYPKPRNPILWNQVVPLACQHFCLCNCWLLFAQSLTTSWLLFLSSLEPVVSHLRSMRSGFLIILIPASFQLWKKPNLSLYLPLLPGYEAFPEKIVTVLTGARIYDCFLVIWTVNPLLWSLFISCLPRVDVNFAHWNHLAVF